MKQILFLASEKQRRRKNGLPQPHRLFLPNGVEIPNVTSVTAGIGGKIEIVLTFVDAKVKLLTKRPEKRK